MKYIIVRTPLHIHAYRTQCNPLIYLEEYVPKSFEFITYDGHVLFGFNEKYNEFKEFNKYLLFVFEVTNQEDFTTFCLQWSELVVKVCEEIPEYFNQHCI
jgi:hypothetical protein